MLYNQSTGKPKVADVFSLASLIAWLETMPADTRYDFCDPHECLAASYLKASGIMAHVLLSCDLKRYGWYEIVKEHPRTYGAALSRALACEGQR